MTVAIVVAAGAFTNVHEAHLARSVLEAAGIQATLGDEHLISMDWTYSNAVGGVKVLVPEDRLEEARLLLESVAELDDPSATGREGEDVGAEWDVCQRCGSTEFESRLPGKRFAILSWLVFGVALGSPPRRRYCRRCGAAASVQSSANR
jgi:hypothetical protein